MPLGVERRQIALRFGKVLRRREVVPFPGLSRIRLHATPVIEKQSHSILGARLTALGGGLPLFQRPCVVAIVIGIETRLIVGARPRRRQHQSHKRERAQPSRAHPYQ